MLDKLQPAELDWLRDLDWEQALREFYQRQADGRLQGSQVEETRRTILGKFPEILQGNGDGRIAM